MSAPVRRPDPWLDLAPVAIVEMLTARGWPARVSAEGVSLMLSSEPDGFCVIITAGREGDAAWRAIRAAHPEGKVRGPRWREEDCSLYVVRQPREPGSAIHTCDLVPGVRVLASGTVPIPPSVSESVQKRWAPDAHAATTEACALPAWVSVLARDPDARRAAELVATRAVLNETSIAPTAIVDMPADNDWERALVRSGRGVKNTFGNLCKIFRGAPEFAGKLRLNEMSQKVELDGVPLPEERIGRIRETIEDAPWGGFSPGKDSTFDAIRTVASERRYHPVREYLNGLAWDGTKRIDEVITRVLRVPDVAITPVSRAIMRKWFISAVARAESPGCKCDTALIFQGAQGRFKSTFFEVLGGEWYGNTEIRIGDKDGLQQIHANWITEWSEFDHITNARHAGEVKAFVARQRDDFRPPYGRNVETYRRSCVIVGSVNPEAFLNDPTGSRRFWVIRVVLEIDIELLREWRDQLWAEAVVAYRSGETFFLDGEQEKERAEAAEAFRVRDSWEDVIEQWLAEKWVEYRIRTGRKYLQTVDVLFGALGLTAKDCNRAAEMRAADALRALGYVLKRVRVPTSEASTYKAPDGSAKPLVRAWLPAMVINTPELDAADVIVLDGRSTEAPDEAAE